MTSTQQFHFIILLIGMACLVWTAYRLGYHRGQGQVRREGGDRVTRTQWDVLEQGWKGMGWQPRGSKGNDSTPPHRGSCTRR
jgi:threonine/homoserine/homoserine lactone efflux protein